MTYLLMDVNNAAYRAFHTTPDLAFAGESTGILFGILRDVVNYANRFNTKNVAFFFDGGYEYRRNLYPEYKKNRHKPVPPEEQALIDESRKEIYCQIDKLRTKILPDIGFTNIFFQKGVEADDLIASACIRIREKAVIVSTDNDLFQCLGNYVIWWNPIKKTPVNEVSFTNEYGIGPSEWAMAKAIAGCSSDNIVGVKGVGEKTACKYLVGTLKSHLKSFQAIAHDCEGILKRFKLTSLPCPGTDKVFLEPQSIDRKKWDSTMKLLGMSSLVGGW